MPSTFSRRQPAPKERKRPKAAKGEPASTEAPRAEGPAHSGAERWRDVDVQRWKLLFADVEAAASGSVDRWPKLRQCAMAWHVAGILYEQHQQAALTDGAYDALSARLLANLAEARAAGAWLEESDLRAGTAMGWRAYPGPAHDVAYALSGWEGELAASRRAGERAPRARR